MRIKDLALEPYEIEMEGPASFTLIRPSLITSGRDQGKLREIQEGYFTSIETVVKKVVALKIHDKGKYEQDTMTLQAFLNDYVRFSNQFNKLLVKALEKIDIPTTLEK